MATVRSTLALMRRQGISYEEAINHVSNLTKASIDKYAADAASTLGLMPGDDLLPIVEQMGGRTHFENVFDASGEENTVYIHRPRDFDILLPFISSPRRDRFTIAHELGHYLLHSQQGKIPLVANRRGSNRAEWEANWFAAGLLMPRDKFRTYMASIQLNLAAAANHFGVSEAAAKVRAQTLALIPA